MKSLKLKKMNEIKNKTKKNREAVLESIMPVLTTSQRDIVCKQFSNTFNTFEDKVEAIFKKNNVDFKSPILKEKLKSTISSVYKYDLLDSEHFTLHKTKTEKLVDIQE